MGLWNYIKHRATGIILLLFGIFFVFMWMGMGVGGFQIIAWIFLILGVICFIASSYFFKTRHH